MYAESPVFDNSCYKASLHTSSRSATARVADSSIRFEAFARTEFATFHQLVDYGDDLQSEDCLSSLRRRTLAI